MNQIAAPWKVNSNLAEVASGRFQASTDITQPHLGLNIVGGGNLFAVLPQRQEQFSQVNEHYVRGEDFVITYDGVPPDDVAAEIYWRAISADDQCEGGCEVIISIHTSQLESDPLVALVSRLPKQVVLDDAKEFAGLAVSVLDDQTHLAVMVHPTDYVQHELSQHGDRQSLSYELFSANLEKGVIRRARARCVLVPASDARRTARAHYEQFAHSEVPLTT